MKINCKNIDRATDEGRRSEMRDVKYRERERESEGKQSEYCQRLQILTLKKCLNFLVRRNYDSEHQNGRQVYSKTFNFHANNSFCPLLMKK